MADRSHQLFGAHAVLSWANTKFSPKKPIAKGILLSRKSLMRRWRFVVPSRNTSWLFPPWWMASNIMTGASVTIRGFDARISLPPCHYQIAWDSSLETQCLQCPRSHFLCAFHHTWSCYLWSEVKTSGIHGGTHPCNTSNSLATFCWEQSLAADNLTLYTSIYSCKLRDMMPSKDDTKCELIWQETHAVLNRQSAWQTSPEVPTTWVTSIPVIFHAVLLGLTSIHYSAG